MTIFGCARVSTNCQSLEAQLAELKKAGCKQVFKEKISGKNRDRPELKRALKALGKGLDRLARSSRDLLNVVKEITDSGASFKSLPDTGADTTIAHGRLILTALGGLAEFEREMLLARTSEGVDRAMAEGVAFGRKRKLTPHQRLEAIAGRRAGETCEAIAASYNVDHSTISRLTSPEMDAVG